MAASTDLRHRRVTVALGLGAVLFCLGAAVAGFRHFRAEVVADSADDQPFRTSPVRATAEAGRPALLTLDAETLRSGAVATRRLEAVRFQPSVPAVGSAVDPVDLATTRDRLAEATQAAGQAATRLEAARARADRSADAARLDEADARAAMDTLRRRRAVALALYGPGLTDWLTSANPELESILQARASLLLLTPLPGYPAPLPAEAVALGRRGEAVPAHLVSVAYRIDPRFQNIAALYETAADPADPHFLPGPAYSATLPVGPPLAGVVVPAAAVFQAGGKAWAYVEESPRQFRRREVSLAHALPDGSGWFQEGDFQPDQTVVVAGAALLLAAEP